MPAQPVSSSPVQWRPEVRSKLECPGERVAKGHQIKGKGGWCEFFVSKTSIKKHRYFACTKLFHHVSSRKKIDDERQNDPFVPK